MPTIDSFLSGSIGATEAGAISYVRAAGIFSQLYFYTTANTVTATSTVQLRKSTANANQSVSIGASATGHFTDLVNKDVAASGDDFHYLITTGGTGTSLTLSSIKMLFDAYQFCVTRFGTLASFALGTASQTTYFAMNASLPATVEANVALDVNVAGQLKNLFLRVESNARTTATTYRTRINTANGVVVISVGSGASGVFEDTTNADTIVANDDICLQQVSGTGVGTLTWRIWQVDFLNTTGEFILINPQTGTYAFTAVRYFPICGVGVASTESLIAPRVWLPIKLTNLNVRILTNTVNSGNSTFTSFKNGIATSLVASVAFGTTGQFEDSSNSANYLLQNDTISTRLIVSGTAGSIDIGGISLRAAQFVRQKLFGTNQALNRARNY